MSADPTNFPVVSIVSDGTGQLTHLGRYFMTSPGRFAGASGNYEFFLIASPRTDGGPGYATEATINGRISY